MSLEDAETAKRLLRGPGADPDRIVPGESSSVRIALLLATPIWGSIIVLCLLIRLVRGRLPLLVVHRRVGHGRRPLGVPKIATGAVHGNRRLLGGLVEVASGEPVEVALDGLFEKWLRRTGLDELPQLLLIASGRMRIVGPRPVTPAETEEMLRSGERLGIDHLHPGLIGLWQVLDRHHYGLDERRDLDLAMVDHWSATLRRRIVGRALRQFGRRLAARSDRHEF